MNIIYLQTREPAAGITCPVRVQFAVAGSLYTIHSAAGTSDPLIDVLNSRAGLRYRSKHHVVSFAAGTDRIRISAVRACKSMYCHTVVVRIADIRVLVIPRHRKSYIAEFNILVACILQCNGPEQGTVVCAHVKNGLYIESLHCTLVCRIQILSLKGDFNPVILNILFDVRIGLQILGSVRIRSGTARSQSPVCVYFNKSACVLRESSVLTCSVGKDHLSHPLMSRVVLLCRIIGKHKIHILTIAVLPVIVNRQR